MEKWHKTALGAFAYVALGFVSVEASAQERPDRDSAPRRPDRADDRETVKPVRVGAIAGVGFPRPLAIEGLVKLRDRVALGVEYGTMPTVTISDVDARLWSLAGDVRVFPFGGALFVGVRGGHQHIGASTPLAFGGMSRTATLDVDAWFVNPRLGFLWTSSFGLTLGAEAGVQVPFASRVSSNLPRGIPESDTVVSVSDALGKQVIPTVNLLRVGFIR